MFLKWGYVEQLIAINSLPPGHNLLGILFKYDKRLGAKANR